MKQTEDQIAKMLSTYESTIRRQAAEKKELEKIIDLLESNARIQAKLLADTGRERDELAVQLVKANRKALEMRNAIDMIEGSLMAWPELTGLPETWGEPRHRKELGLRDIKGNCGQLYRVYDAMMECNRIINADEFNPDQFTVPEDHRKS